MGIRAKFDLFPHRFNWRDGRGCFWLMGQNLFDTETKSAQKKYIQIKENVRFLLLTSDQKELLQSSSHLSVWFLRLLPADHHRVLWNNVSLDISGWACRGLLSCSGLHACRGGPLADAIEGGHSDFILGVGIQSTDAVAGGGDAVHGLVLAVWPFCSILNDVIGYRVWVTGVPGDGHTGGGGLGDYGCARRLW